MKFLIISHVSHKVKPRAIYAYAPYVREMNLWLQYADNVEIVAPKVEEEETTIELQYRHNNIRFNEIPAIQFTSLKYVITSIFKFPRILFTVFIACRRADHIHLRCPGNIGLLGCFIQVLFPKKIKTAKYAGNWDPKAKQPLSYKLQKWILGNTFLTKNMTALVYGKWKGQTKNIKSFFTASFEKTEFEKPMQRDYSSNLEFVFIGSLVKGKRPLLAIQIIEALQKAGKKVHLDLYGDGVLKKELAEYVINNNLEKVITLKGNQEKKVIKEALKKAHFIVLPSKSEGWPKAIAEAMFFGAIPIATPISCVPNMLDYGNRGILIDSELSSATLSINKELKDTKGLSLKSEKASKWSKKYTLDKFDAEISNLVKK